MERTALQTVKMVADIAKRMHDEQDRNELVRLFRSAEPLIEDLDVEARTYPGGVYIEEKLMKLRWNLGAMARLNDGNGHAATQHYVWSLGALSTLRGQLGFGRQAPARESE